ncbi:hypothetical protein QQS21_000539 [Conoideocrella luteorostrata]|uniref:2EXR domain-containing protein n=1 Tax=Conoideocrella luteorostrata TaxID=1105319 RepID=A0AAJ0D0X3_9HYPO|nr:hypothetical protein QQS21_000539 [Conoideocrella luteorostrata]
MATFHRFPLFPWDIRRLIWEASVQPRTVDARCDPAVPYIRSTTPAPAVLHACSETRNIGLYEKAFQSSEAEPRYIWVDFEIDMISIGRSEFDFLRPKFLHIRRLKYQKDDSRRSIMDMYPNLKEIHLDFMCMGVGATLVFRGGWETLYLPEEVVTFGGGEGGGIPILLEPRLAQ